MPAEEQSNRDGRPAAAVLKSAARAKINLNLHILGKRADGFHDLQSLVVFADMGDDVALLPGAPLGLHIDGPFAAGLSPASNLVLDAAALYLNANPGAILGHFHLNKQLPVASGIGGGSADAAAALRLLDQVNGDALSEALHRLAAQLGSDVPVCVDSATCWLAGRGEILRPVRQFAPLDAVLINPDVPVATADVFRALALPPGSSTGAMPMPDTLGAREDILRLLRATRNDLEGPACQIAPLIGHCLEALRTMPDCLLARMSGSGATVFGLFADAAAARKAAAIIGTSHVDWWVRAVKLGAAGKEIAVNRPG